ncbi:hypothetical protein JQ543_14540 [Bradyrhizobium diazoefficiens]|nr:hypothetical protein [Bradyrhizobium diazoefficiens]MBR0848966.1 hypothetical protein [Bradyrhizobium diazoefficiens]
MNLHSPDPIDATAGGARTAPQIRRYLLVMAATSALIVTIALIWGETSHDHFASYPLKGDTAFYRDFSGRRVPEIQDQELFYHNLGGSVAAAKAADIIALGPSFVSYALDKRVLRQFEADSGRRVYNMSFIGIRGGEFSRRIIARWGIEAPLWVINADDQFIHFFSRSLDLTLGPVTTTIPAAAHGRIRGYVSAAARNLRWRIEDYISYYRTGDGSANGLFRNIATGDVTVDLNPRYVAEDNKEIPFDRGRDCHASPQTIDIARQYLKDIGGQVVLTMVPHSQYCPAQARELAKALGLEILVPPDAGYTTMDGGGHLDQKGAERFTRFLTSELVKTDAYRKAFGAARHDVQPSTGVEGTDTKDPAGVPPHTAVGPRLAPTLKN